MSESWADTSKPQGWHNPFERPWQIADLLDYDAWRWVPYAACRDAANPEEFFRKDPESNKELRTLCQSCQVIDDCLAYAMRNDEHGWWGGTSRRTRKRLREQR